MKCKTDYNAVFGVRVTIADMPEGAYGVTEDKKLYYRTMESAACLSCVGHSYSSNAGVIDDVYVRLLAPGSVIAISPKWTREELENYGEA